MHKSPRALLIAANSSRPASFHMLPAAMSTLAAFFPGIAKAISSIVRRLSDLLPVVRGGVYHPGFGFSNSIKNAAPALCPDITHDDLEDIADGAAASTAFWLMANGRADAETSARLRRSLPAYCHRDTWAMVRLHQALYALAVEKRTETISVMLAGLP
jgi:hypothetical protein